MLERFKEGIEVKHKPDDSTVKKNEKRQTVIKEYFEESFTVTKDQFTHYLKDKLPDVNVGEKLNTLSFEEANPRNNHFMNELMFAGEAMTEGFLDCFNIQRDKALEKYLSQLQVIEKIDEGKNQFYIGTFKDNELLRATPYQDSIDKLHELVMSRNNKKQEQNQQQNQQQTRGLNRRKEDY